MWQLHSNRLNKFSEDNKNVPKFKEELFRLRQAEVKLRVKKTETTSPNILREINKHLKTCVHGIDKLTKKLHNIRNSIDYTDYVLGSVSYLNRYHTGRRELDIEEQKARLNPDHSEINIKRRYYNYYFKQLTTDYKKKFFPHLVRNLIDHSFQTSRKEIFSCPECEVNYIHHKKKGELVCPSCGAVSPIRSGGMGDDIGHCSYDRRKNISMKRRANTYKRLNHFREYIRQRQGKSHPKIPEDIFSIIRKEIKKYYNKTPSCGDIHYYLKKFKLADYYEDVPLITKKFNSGCDILNLSSMEEEKLCLLFVQTEAPYEKHKKSIRSTRKNFMSYPYVCYKLCEMIGMEQHMKYFPLLKTDSLISEQDRWWEQVCYELGWEYINTVGNINLPSHEKPGIVKNNGRQIEPLGMFQTNEEFIRGMDDIDKFTTQTTISELKNIISNKMTTSQQHNKRKRKRQFSLQYGPSLKKIKLAA